MTKAQRTNIAFRMRSVRSAKAFLKECECTDIKVKETSAGVAGYFTARTGERWFIGAITHFGPIINLKYYIHRVNSDEPATSPIDTDDFYRTIIRRKR